MIVSVQNTYAGVNVTWAQPEGAVNYRVFRKTGSGSWVKLGDTTALNYIDRTAAAGTAYKYTIRCLASDGRTYTSGYDTAGRAITYIAAPALGSVQNVNNGVRVTWSKSAGAEKYRVLRKTGSGGWTKLADTATLNNTDSTVVSGTKYAYTVRCVAGDGKSYTSGYDTTGKAITVP